MLGYRSLRACATRRQHFAQIVSDVLHSLFADRKYFSMLADHNLSSERLLVIVLFSYHIIKVSLIKTNSGPQ